jgi:hypothetical protein
VSTRTMFQVQFIAEEVKCCQVRLLPEDEGEGLGRLLVLAEATLHPFADWSRRWICTSGSQ